MAGDHQRRFEEIMSKLSQSAPPPKKKSFLTSDGIGKKKAELGISVSTMESVNKQCRPWDRGDLMRRLATFKAMTWFGKPKAISPVNCARRGWINIEMDVIACEACGAHLLFSTPSSWTLQQVEKAAAVFSLKLDNGHKMLCPWINNACDEKLALFPPTPPAALVNSFKERSSALLRLTALPNISPLAIDCMKSPQLEHFLSQFSCLPVSLGNGISLTGSKALESASEDAPPNTYYKALKIISLCGWEPSMLPYVVDNEIQPSEPSGERLGEQKNNPIIYTSGSIEDEVGNNNQLSLAEYQYDPSSTVLNCRFCGARVGLWAFATVQCHLESFIVVADPNGLNESASGCKDLVKGQETLGAESSRKDYQNIGTISTEPPVGLKLMITGGPLPTKQKFRPVVSFPIISRHLRAEFASKSAFQGCLSSELFCGNHENSDHHLQIDALHQQQNDKDGGLAKSVGSLKRKRSDNDFCVSKNNDIGDPSHSTEELLDVRHGIGAGEKCRSVSSESRNCKVQDVHTLHGDTDDNVNSDDIKCGSHRNNTISDGAEKNALSIERKLTGNVEAGETISTTSSDVIIREPEAYENNSVANLGDVSKFHGISFSQVQSLNADGNSEQNHGNPSDVASCSTFNAVLTSNQITETGKEVEGSDFKNFDVAMTNDQNVNEVGIMALPSAHREVKADHALGNILKESLHPKLSEFDPVRQHRPFCPWIASEGGKSLPGWRLTLSALIQPEKVSSSHPQSSDAPSASFAEVDDSIVSIRKLFMSPATRRFKGAR